MDIIRKIKKPAVWILALHMLMLSGPYQAAWAAIIRTDALVQLDPGDGMRQRLNNYLVRKDVRAILESRGIDPLEVQARIDSLTDAELEQIVDQIDQLPAGGGFFETFLIVPFLVFVALLLTDIAGYTDVFPFVNKRAAASTPRTPAQAPASQSSPNARTPLIVYFNRNSNDLTAKSFERLDRVAFFMAQNPQTKIRVIGFSDATGTPSYDQMVSSVRANTVKNYLIAKGVAPSKISTSAEDSRNSSVDGANSQQSSRVIIEFK